MRYSFGKKQKEKIGVESIIKMSRSVATKWLI